MDRFKELEAVRREQRREQILEEISDWIGDVVSLICGVVALGGIYLIAFAACTACTLP